MSKRLLSAALIAGLGMAFVPGANAADGTITITGKIMSQSCSVKINGGAASDTVILPAIAKDAFAADGDTAGDTKFTIDLSGCDTQFSSLNAAAVFDATGHVDATTHNLLTDAGVGAATGIQIQLTDDLGTSPIDLTGTDAASQNSPSVDVHSGTGTLKYQARYYSKGVVGAGTVNTTVAYTIAYL